MSSFKKMAKNLLKIAAMALLLLFQVAQAQNFETLKDRNGKKLLKGFITDSLLQNDTTAFKWYPEAQKAYTAADKAVKAVAAQKDSLNFIVFMGTWCPDSHFVIPRYFKILESAGFDKKKITLIAMDRSKKDNNNLSAALGIEHVPTIIAYKNGHELGRVVEYGPSGKFDEELAKIINGH